MGEVKRRKILLEGITREEAMKAFATWVAISVDVKLEWYGKSFEKYVGCELEFESVVLWMLPKHARRLKALNSPHWYALTKARMARRKRK